PSARRLCRVCTARSCGAAAVDRSATGLGAVHPGVDTASNTKTHGASFIALPVDLPRALGCGPTATCCRRQRPPGLRRGRSSTKVVVHADAESPRCPRARDVSAEEVLEVIDNVVLVGEVPGPDGGIPGTVRRTEGVARIEQSVRRRAAIAHRLVAQRHLPDVDLVTAIAGSIREVHVQVTVIARRPERMRITRAERGGQPWRVRQTMPREVLAIGGGVREI